MGTTPKITEEQRVMVLNLVKAGTKYEQIAVSINKSVSCVKIILNRDKFTLDLPPKTRVVKRVTDGRIGQRLKEIITSNPRTPYRKLPGVLNSSMTAGTRIPSASTCQRFLKENGFEVVKMSKKPLISDVNKGKRRQFAREYVQKSDDFLGSIVWSDETTVRQLPKDKERLIWTHNSTIKENRQTNLQVHSGGFSVMFGELSLNLVLDL